MKHPRRLVAAVIAAAAMALLGAGPLPAQAADPTITLPPGGVTLNVHKYLGDPINTPGMIGDGRLMDPGAFTGRAPLAGVAFDAYQVFYDANRTQKVDLTTNQGWVDAKDIRGYVLTATDIANGYFQVGGTGPTYYLGNTPNTKFSKTTDETGLASFNPLAGIGLYLVNENLTASDPWQDANSNGIRDSGEGVAKSSLTAAAPFFVTLPMTDPVARDSWMYTVHVYPKNQFNTVTKTVKDGNLTADQWGYAQGQRITYEIGSYVPTLSDVNSDGVVNGADLGYYYIGDSLSPALTARSVAVSVPGLTLSACDATNLPASPACDYYYWLDRDGSAANGSQVKVVFSTSGLTNLATRQGQPVTTTIVAEITDPSKVGANGLLANRAFVIPSQGWWTADGHDALTAPSPTVAPTGNGNGGNGTGDVPPLDTNGVPSTTTQSFFGQIIVSKSDPKTAGVDMSGTQFSLYVDANGDDQCQPAEVGSGATPIASSTIDNNSPSSVGFNRLAFTGLQVSDWYNGTQQSDLHGYCLVETKARTDYSLLAKPIPVVGLSYSLRDSNGVPTYTQVVENLRANLGNNLPFTGGQGVTALSLAGGLLVLAGLAFYLVSSRRRRHAG